MRPSLVLSIDVSESSRVTSGCGRTTGLSMSGLGSRGVTKMDNRVKLLQRANASGASNRIADQWLFALRINHEERNYVS